MKRAPAANTAEKPAASAERDPKRPAPGIDVEAATRVVLNSLDDDKAEEIISIDIRGKSSFADMLVVASGRSARHVAALADHVMRKLKEAGVNDVRVEGLPQADYAAQHGLSLSAAKSRVQRARERLRARLAEACQVRFDERGRVEDFAGRRAGVPS